MRDKSNYHACFEQCLIQFRKFSKDTLLVNLTSRSMAQTLHQRPDTNGHSGLPTGLNTDDAERVREALESARAPATRRVYASQWRRFTDWADRREVPTLPASPSAVAAYLSERAASGASIATLRLCRASIAAAHADANLDDPCSHPGVRRTMSGLARMLGRATKQAAPLTSDVAAAVRATAMRPRQGPSGRMESMKIAERRGLLDIALVSVMRDALLRRSEASDLVWDDIEPMADGSGRVTVRKSKTDQTSEGRVLFLSERTMSDLEAIRPTQDDRGRSPVFGLSGSQIGRRIARACEIAGFPGAFSGHSPRVGMAQDLAANGTELPALMEAGRWESPSMPARYTRSQAAGRGAVANYYSRR